MVRTLFVSLTIVFGNVCAHAQDSAFSNRGTRLERYELVLGSSVAFSLVDYIGYNILVKSDPSRTTQILELHLFNAAFGAAINYFLYKTCGLPSALSFDLIWWTFGLDLGFSGWGDVVNPAYPWINRSNSSLNTSRWGNSLTWAGWTPVGLLRPPRSNIALSTLYAQAIIGFSISMAILW